MTIVKTALQIKTIGSILKEKRKEQKLELKQVSDIIKIRVDYLQALEDGNYASFPSEVYLKGFLKKNLVNFYIKKGIKQLKKVYCKK